MRGHHFEITQNRAGEYVAFFKYNNETIFQTEGYSSSASARSAIDALKNRGPGAEFEDNTDVAADPAKHVVLEPLASNFILSEERLIILKSALTRADSELDKLGASNSEKAQARAYIVAVKALADAPEPPSELIWALLNKAATVATIASLFISIIQAYSK